MSRYRFFKGDARGFNSEGAGYRTRVDVGLAYDMKDTPLTFKKDVGQSIAYNYLKKVRAKAVASIGIELEHRYAKERLASADPCLGNHLWCT